MKKGFKNILFILIIIVQVLSNTAFVKAGEDDKIIFSFEKDGYWKPGDIKSHDFILKNIWNEECYVDYLYFKYSYVKDSETDKKYTVEEAVQEGLIENYNVSLNMVLNDKEILLYEGTLRGLTFTKIELDHNIFMKLDSEIKFNMVISFNELTDNKAQNKQLEYIITPEAFKVIKDQNGDSFSNVLTDAIKTGDNFLINGIIQTLSLIFVLSALLLLWKKSKWNEL